MFRVREPNAIDSLFAAISEFFTRDVLARLSFLCVGGVLIFLAFREVRIGGFTHFREFQIPAWETVPWLSATGAYCIYLGVRKKPPD